MDVVVVVVVVATCLCVMSFSGMCLFLGDRYKNGLPCATGPLSCMSVALLHWYIVGKRLDGSRCRLL